MGERDGGVEADELDGGVAEEDPGAGVLAGAAGRPGLRQAQVIREEPVQPYGIPGADQDVIDIADDSVVHRRS
jgi:hypothetical protein